MADKFNIEQNKMIIDPSIEKEAKNLEQNPYESIEKQVQAEFNLAWDHQYQKKLEALVRLKMYNNQMRDKGAVGDTTMFAIHNTVLASLYIDKLMTDFNGREEGDDEVAENLNQMYEFDYEEMMKDLIDYDWDWDTCFFGRGILYLSEFIRDPDNGIFVPCPEVVDPTTFLRDPRGVAINGNTRTGKNSCRFFGREVRMTRDAMEKNINFFKDLDWKDIKFGNGLKSLTEESHRARTEAQGNQYAKFVNANESKLGDNAEYQLTEWNTHWKIKGNLKKVVLYLANDRKKLVGLRTVGDPSHLWEAVDRPLYPTSHDWDGTSIPDLTEDKQRHRAVAQNLGMRAMTADLYPNYIYDQNKIKNRNDLNIGFNKMTPSDGNPNDAIVPQRKTAPNMQLLQFIYNSLDLSAQKATACYSDDTQTLTENGWKYYWEINEKKERIATFNPKTEKIEYHLPVKKLVYDYEGDMYHYQKDDSVDLLVSPEHKIWYRSADHKKLKKKNGWKLEPADKIKLKNIEFLVGANWDGVEKKEFVIGKYTIKADDWLEFLGYFISEGCVYLGTESHKQNRINIAQKSGEDCKLIEKCLRKLPIKVNKRKNKQGYIHFDFYDKDIVRWVLKNIGRYSYGKSISKEIKNLSQRQLKILFDTYMIGDGSYDTRDGRDSSYFSTVSQKLADDLQEICLKLGYKTKLIKRTDKCGGNRLPYYRISISSPNKTTPEVRIKKDLIIEKYKGVIYCFQVPNHLFVTRRNGLISIQGNTPDIQQGIQSAQDRTLGENNMIASNVDTRYSLSAKVFGWSEKAFARQWYTLYKENFADNIDKKIIRISGAFGAKWRPLDRSNIIATVDPDVSVESKIISRAKELEDRQGLTSYFSLVLADPTANRRYAYRKLGKLYGMKKDEMDRLLPPTIDERQAEDENDLLNEGKFVRVLPEQDHNVHLEMHSKAKEGKNTATHIETHKHALMIKKTNPELFPTPEVQGDTSYTPSGSAGNVPTPNGGGQPMMVKPSMTSGQ